MEQLIQQSISILINLLLWPVVIALLAGMGYSLYILGNMIVESFQRKGAPERLTDYRKPSEYLSRLQGIREWKKQMNQDAGASPWLLLDRTEAALKRRIDGVKIWVKLGPALGLAGTLIPLGSAMSALAANNLKLLSDGLLIAFGTTVLGLISGAICMIVVFNYERWYGLDLAEIRHALEAEEQLAEERSSAEPQFVK
jgi:biopolymer transport protein ExbB/TolQ